LGLDGAAITVFASGFLTPANNSNGPAFGLWVALASGGDLIPLSISTGVEERARVGDAIALYPNPAALSTTLEITEQDLTRMDLRVVDLAGRDVLGLGTQVLARGPNRLTLDVSTLAPGSYRLLMRTAAAAAAIPLTVVR
ncbi:MAG TPA: T9SS type A sorting domain-containing protein, partial [Flavobacteriales bacterium]|nr:T9SS type A sorting domain-containing protein [Flavobacteriales bacterium]